MDYMSPSVETRTTYQLTNPPPLSSSPLDVVAPLTIVLGRFPMHFAKKRGMMKLQVVSRRRQPRAIFRRPKSLRLCRGLSHQSLTRILTGS